MSVKVMAEVFKHSQATLGARLVLLAIADNANDDDRAAWPSVETIARKANLSERAVQYAIRSLVAQGELEIMPRPGSSHCFRVLVGGEASFTGAESAPPQTLHPRGEASFTPGVKPASPRTISEPSKNHQVRARAWPDEFKLTLERAAVARELQVDAASEWAKFKDNALKDGKTYKNWDAAWSLWCRRAPDFQRRTSWRS